MTSSFALEHFHEPGMEKSSELPPSSVIACLSLGHESELTQGVPPGFYLSRFSLFPVSKNKTNKP